MEPKYYSSWHLAKTDMEYRVTEFEWAMIRFHEAFSRFVLATGAVTIATITDIKYEEHVILHVIRMQDRPKNSATIARLINRDDIPNIQYSLRKLESVGLIEKHKDKNNKTFSYCATAEGIRATDEYYKVREVILMKRLEEMSDVSDKLEKGARLLSMMTGMYEEAARDSATITPQDTLLKGVKPT